MNSFNHYAFGSVGEYLYRQVAGIDTDGPGFRKIIIHPAIAAGLTNAQAAYDSPAGRIESAWRIDGKRFRLNVTVPPNTTAAIYMPAGAGGQITEGGKPVARSRGVSLLRSEDGATVFSAGSGKYQFESQLP
jgi:alpha-L-rhamnosidase